MHCGHFGASTESFVISDNTLTIEKHGLALARGDADFRLAVDRALSALYETGKKLGKMVLATGDSHFIDPQDEIYRRILHAGMGYGVERQAPLNYNTTDELKKDFEYFFVVNGVELRPEGGGAYRGKFVEYRGLYDVCLN